MPLLFMLSMSLFGLEFYPALLFIAIILFKEFRGNRYNFVIELTILFGSFGMYSNTLLPIKLQDIALVLSLVLAFLYRKDLAEKKTLVVWGAYAAGLIVLATYSIESLSIQFLSLRLYLLFIYFIVPVACFAGRSFDIKEMFRKVILFSIIFCSFYILDVLVFGCNFLVPATATWDGISSTFYKPRFHFFHPQERKYPPGIYFAILSIYPIARYFKVSWLQLGIILLGIAVTKTFSIISGFALFYIFFIGRFKIFIKACLILLGLVVSLYFVDGLLPKDKSHGTVETKLRIKSSVDQVVSLSKAVDIEDIAQFASGRVGQILPKAELVYKEHKQWTGLGFLHPEYTKINRYIIFNEFYSDISQGEELASGVEVVPAQIFLTVGYIGLGLHALFLLFLWLIVRKMKYSGFFACTMLMCCWCGLAGFTNLNSFDGLGITSLAYACVLLANRRPQRSGKRKVQLL